MRRASAARWRQFFGEPVNRLEFFQRLCIGARKTSRIKTRLLTDVHGQKAAAQSTFFHLHQIYERAR